MKRQDYISYEYEFMAIAAICSYRSKDPNTQHGCVIVSERNRILSTGYNGFPEGCSDDEFPWTSPEKYPIAEHSERNAIYNAVGSGRDLRNSTLYLYSEKGYYPCAECARGIIQVGIKKIVMASQIKEDAENWHWTPTFKMFEAAGVEIEIMQSAIDAFLDVSNKLKVSADITTSIRESI